MSIKPNDGFLLWLHLSCPKTCKVLEAEAHEKAEAHTNTIEASELMNYPQSNMASWAIPEQKSRSIAVKIISTCGSMNEFRDLCSLMSTLCP